MVLQKGYIPKFNNAFEHFLLHTGGRAVIDEMEEKLSLTAAQCQPSKDALYRFGNTSAASTWCVPNPCCQGCVRFSSASFLSLLKRALLSVDAIHACLSACTPTATELS